MHKETTTFALRGARSGAVLAGFGIAIVVETLVVHLWLRAHHPAWAWSLTVLSAASIVWLVVEYRAMADAAVRVDHAVIDVAVGHRAVARIPRSHVTSAILATWRDVPDGPLPT